MNYSTKINWAFFLSLLVSVIWLVGDILLLGIKPADTNQTFTSDIQRQLVDIELVAAMLNGSIENLRLGALLGALSAPLLLAAMWLVFQFFQNKRSAFAIATYYVLLIGSVFSPLAHAAFYFLGALGKIIVQTNQQSQSEWIHLLNEYTVTLQYCWGAAIVALALGWLMFSIAIFINLTYLPRWFGFLTPLFLTLIQEPIVKYLLPEPASTLLSGADFNISYVIFFVALLIVGRKKLTEQSRLVFNRY